MEELDETKRAYRELIDDYTANIQRLELANAQVDNVLWLIYWEYKKTGHLTPELMDKIKNRLGI